MRIHFMRDYTDRFGVFHRAGSDDEMPDHIAAKLVRLAWARMPNAPDPVESVVSTAAFAPTENAAPRTVKAAPGRPRKG